MLTKRNTAIVLSAMAIISLQGCAGGGGGGGGVTAPPATSTPTAFTSWSAVQPNSTVKITGKSLVANYSGSGPSGSFVVSTVSAPTQGSADALLTYDGSLNLTGIAINTTNPTSSVSWTGAEISCSTYVCTTSSTTSTGTAVGYAANAIGAGWNYQTFGVWDTFNNSSSGGQVGAMSVGSLTPISGMPTSGSGTYTGAAAGYYVDSSGTPYLTAATMNATANFGGTTPSVSFSTTGTSIENLNTAATSSASNLDMTGNLSIAAGTNSFSGTVTTSSMTGTASGNFYGPSANEIGGTYSLTGSSQAMIGGFGGN